MDNVKVCYKVHYYNDKEYKDLVIVCGDYYYPIKLVFSKDFKHINNLIQYGVITEHKNNK